MFAIVLLATACTPLVRPAGPPASEPQLLAEAIRADDGILLPVHAWLPNPRKPRAVILALHGFNDYGNFFAAAGAWLAARGIASYAYDQRGFGATPGRGYWPGMESLTRDLRTAVASIRRRHPGLPLYLLGESMGGAVVIAAMAERPPPEVDGVILAAPAVWGRDTMWWGQAAVLWVVAHTVPGLTLTGRGLGIRPSDNVAMLQALGRDPKVIKETRVDAIYGLVNLMDAALAAAARIGEPALILYGERDELIPREAVQTMFERLPAEPGGSLRVALYQDGYHMLLRDLQAETVWADIAAWITDPSAPLPSGADTRATFADTCRSWRLCDKVHEDPAAPAAADARP